MIKENEKIGLKEIYVEDIRSLEQDLTFDELTKAFSKRNMEFGEIQKRTLG